MVATPGVSKEGHLSVELTRVWDLKKTGQVPTTGKVAAGICCIFFHPIDPTLCVITAQGPQSILCFYNAISGGRLATVNLRGAAVEACFTRDGRQVVVAFRDWSVMILRPGTNTWIRQVVFWKKDPKPSNKILLSVNPSPKPVVFLASYDQPKLYIIYGAVVQSKKIRLRSSEQKTYTSIKLEKNCIIDIAGHPQDSHQVLVMFNDGTIQSMLLEQTGVKRLYSVGEPSNTPVLGSLCVMPNPFVPGSMLVLAASGGVLSTYQSSGREELQALDFFPIRDIRRVHGMGLDKVSNLLMVFGETSNGVLQCFAARVCGSATTGVQISPVPAHFSQTATDVTQGKAGRGSIQLEGDNDGWVDMWVAVPAWAQGTGQIGAARPRIKSVQFHPSMGAMAAQVSAASPTTGPHVLMWSMSDESHPLAGSLSGAVTRLHTSLEFWGVQQGTEREKVKLKFPHHFYFLEENKLRSYSLAAKESIDLQSFRPASANQVASAQFVIYSAVKRTWLVFFRKSGSNEKEKWVYTLVREGEVGAIQPWFAPGVSGAFMGPHDEFFAVLQPDRITLKVYSTATANGTDSGVLTIPLPHPGLLTPAIFPGPPIYQLPMPGNNEEELDSGSEHDEGDVLVDLDNGYEDEYNEEQEEVVIEEDGEEEEGENDEDVRTGFGVLLWINKFRQIVMGSMVVEGKQEEGGQGAVEGFIVGELADGEVVVQVSWQKLLEDDDSLLQPNASVCAMLTNQRVMLFLANGYPISSYPPRNSRGMATEPTSCIWVGPALLYVTQSGEVMQLLWDGSTTMICGAPSTTGTLLLAAVLADRILFLVRDPDTWAWETTTRHAYIGHALLMGWGSLGASGVMPPEWVHTHARKQLRVVCENFDTSMMSVPVARALVSSGFPDVAKVVADRWPFEADAVKVACSVAAGEWSSAERGLLKEHQASVYYPCPAPKGSTLWRRLFSVSLGAISRGHWDVGVKLLEAAGEWEHALVVAGLADNGDAIRSTRENAESNLDAARSLELERLKKQLLEACRHSSGPAPLTKPDDSLLGDNPRTWSLAQEGSVPVMESIQGETPSGLIRVGDIGRILPLDRKDIQGYMFGAAKMARAGSVMSSMRFSSMSEISIAPTDSSLEFAGDVLQVGGANDSDGDAGGQTGGIMHDFKDLIGDDGFSSSDEEATGGDGKGLMLDDGASDLSRGGVFGKKFKIEIKSREDANSGASADVLRDAAKKLRMGGLGLGPSLGPGGFAQALKGATGLTRQDSYSSVSSSGTALDVLSSGGGDHDHSRPPSLSTLYSGEHHGVYRSSGALSPPLPTKMLPPPSASRTTSPGPLSPAISPLVAPAPAPAPSAPWQQFDPFDPFSQPPIQTQLQEDPGTSFTRGVTLMEGGKWTDAESAFSQTIGASGGAGDLASKAKQYLAAVTIMKQKAKCTPDVSARLMRYAGALKLDSKHSMALRKSSITENIVVQNYGYAAKELTSLITASIGTAPPEVANRFQDQLNECDRRGATDANLPADEDLESFSEIIGLASNAGEVENTVIDLLRG